MSSRPNLDFNFARLYGSCGNRVAQDGEIVRSLHNQSMPHKLVGKGTLLTDFEIGPTRFAYRWILRAGFSNALCPNWESPQENVRKERMPWS